MYDSGVTYMFVQHNNVYLMAASRQNCNAASILLFLHRVIEVPLCSLENLIYFKCYSCLMLFLFINLVLCRYLSTILKSWKRNH